VWLGAQPKLNPTVAEPKAKNNNIAGSISTNTNQPKRTLLKNLPTSSKVFTTQPKRTPATISSGLKQRNQTQILGKTVMNCL